MISILKGLTGMLKKEERDRLERYAQKSGGLYATDNGLYASSAITGSRSPFLPFLDQPPSAAPADQAGQKTVEPINAEPWMRVGMGVAISQPAPKRPFDIKFIADHIRNIVRAFAVFPPSDENPLGKVIEITEKALDAAEVGPDPLSLWLQEASALAEEADVLVHIEITPKGVVVIGESGDNYHSATISWEGLSVVPREHNPISSLVHEVAREVAARDALDRVRSLAKHNEAA